MNAHDRAVCRKLLRALAKARRERAKSYDEQYATAYKRPRPQENRVRLSILSIASDEDARTFESMAESFFK